MGERTHFTVLSIVKHYGTRAKITLQREGNNVHSSENVEISLTLEEAAQLSVGSTYILDFAPIQEAAADGQGT